MGDPLVDMFHDLAMEKETLAGLLNADNPRSHYFPAFLEKVH